MSEFSIYKMVKTRKPHKCGYCNKIIPKGFTVEFSSGMFEDQFYRYWMCEFCRKWIDETKPDLSDGFNPDFLCEDLNNYGYILGYIDYINKIICIEDMNNDDLILIVTWDIFFNEVINNVTL